MIYNTGHRFLHIAPPLTQEEIWRCPEYFACSREEILSDAACTDALRRALDEFPWSGRHTVIQVRPQDWRNGRPSVLGDGWHIDVNVRLADGVDRKARSMDDWRLLVCSWGDVTETDFMSRPLDLPEALPPCDYQQFFHRVGQLEPLPFVTPAPNQLVEYTSRDIHRVGSRARYGRFRLMIVAFETDDVPAGGRRWMPLCDRRGADDSSAYHTA